MKNFIFTLLVLLGVCHDAGASVQKPWNETTPEEHTFLNDFFGAHNILPPLPEQRQELTERQKQAFERAITEQQSLAFTGDGHAMIRAGLLYQKRHDYSQSGEDRVAAVYWYGMAANKDMPSALVKLGLCMMGGFGCLTDENTPRNVLALYRRASELGFIAGTYLYLELVASKFLEPTPDDLKQAFAFNKRLVELVPVETDPVIYVSLASRLRRGTGCQVTPQGLTQALALYEKAANVGYLVAIGNMGLCYQSGIGCEKDFLKANLWFQKGAVKGDADCMFALANNLYNHRGVKLRPENHVRVLELLRKGTDKQHTLCQAALGICLYRGIGCEIEDKNFDEAFQHLSKAWGKGSDIAGYHLAFLLDRGLGCEDSSENEKKAASIYKELVGRCFTPAFFPYGHFLQYGKGLPIHSIHSNDIVKCFVIDAAQGGISALERLMYCSLFGVGCPMDRGEVPKWYRTIRQSVTDDGPTVDAAEICMGWYYASQICVDGSEKALEHFSKVVYNAPILKEMAVLYMRLKKHKEALDCMVQASYEGAPIKASLLDYLSRRWHADSLKSPLRKYETRARANKKPVVSEQILCKAELEAVLTRYLWMSEHVMSRINSGRYYAGGHYAVLAINLEQSFRIFLEKAREAKGDSAKKSVAVTYDTILDKVERQIYFLELGVRDRIMKEVVEDLFKMQWAYYVPKLCVFE